MVYLVTYRFEAYVPGAYDDFLEALDNFRPRYVLPTGELLVVSDAGARSIARGLGRLLDEKDYLYIIEFDYDKFAGTITPQLDRFLSTYKRKKVFGREVM